MIINTKQELYDYLNNFDFKSKKDSPLSSVYFLVKHDDVTEPIYFTPYEDVWFESPCEMLGIEMNEDELKEFVKEIYEEKYWEDAFKYESLLQKDGFHYDIDTPQCSPFLPDKIEIVGVLSERECMEWMLECWRKIKEERESSNA